MKVLAIDTSTPYGAVGLIEDQEPIAESAIKAKETHSARLLPTIDYLLKASQLTLDDIDLFGAVIGPGSFTGLRVGLATMKGFAWSQGKPLTGITSLEVLAENVRGYPGLFAPMLDARRNRVFGAIFRWKGEELEIVEPISDTSASDLAQKATEKLFCFGSGARKYADVIREVSRVPPTFGPGSLDLPHGIVAARLCLEHYQKGEVLDVHGAEPTYLRPCEAEIKERGLAL